MATQSAPIRIPRISFALARSRMLLNREQKDADFVARAATLSPREREIVRLIVKGLINKEIADRLNLALVTVKVHRSHAMHKLGADNPAELTRIAIQAGLLEAK